MSKKKKYNKKFTRKDKNVIIDWIILLILFLSLTYFLFYKKAVSFINENAIYFYITSIIVILLFCTYIALKINSYYKKKKIIQR